MSLTINGATNTLTAASGLTIAGNTAVTGTLSASGSATFGGLAGGTASGITSLVTASAATAVVGGTQFTAIGYNGGYGAGITMASPASAGAPVAMAKIVADGTSSWTSTASTQDAQLSFHTTTDGTLTQVGTWDTTKLYLSSGYFQVGSGSAASAGWVAGNHSSGIGGIWSTAVTPSTNNYSIAGDSSTTYLNGPTTSAYINIAGVSKLAVTSTLNTSVNPLSVTDATDSSSTTTGSLKTAGGLAVAKKGYFGDNIVMSKSTDASVGVTTTGTNNAAIVELYSGNGTTSGRYAYTLMKSLETTPQQWIAGMVAGKNYLIQNNTLGNTPLQIDATNGNISTVGNIVMASGKGIDFSATSDGSGTTTSEVFDDYETGTWTPTVTASSGSITTVGAVAGTYTKKGREVTLSFDVTITTNGTGAGSLKIQGLPFAGSQATVTYYSGAVYNHITGIKSTAEYNPGGSHTVHLWKYDGTYPAADGSRFIGSLTYNV